VERQVPNFAINGSFTLETWILADAFYLPSQRLFEKGNCFRIQRSASTNRIEFRTTHQSTSTSLVSSVDIQPAVWTHIAAVYDQESKTKRLFVNGVPAGQQTVTGINEGLPPLVIGSQPDDSRIIPLPARIDSLRLWNTARSTEQILADIDRDLTIFDVAANLADRSVDGLFAEWRFDGITPSRLPDASGNKRDAVSPSIAAVDIVEGLGFRPPPPLAADGFSAMGFSGGVDARIVIADPPARFIAEKPLLEIKTAITLEAWVNLGQFDKPWQAILTKGDDWGITRYDETSRLAFHTSQGGAPFILEGTTALVPGRWYHLSASWDGVNKRIYIDGILDASASWSGPLDAGNNDIVIGGKAGTPGREFKGAIDEVRIWSVGRSLVEIMADSGRKLTGFEPALRGYWRFDEAAADSAKALDETYFGADGVLVAGVARSPGLAQTALLPPVATVRGGALYFPSDLAVQSSVVVKADERLSVTDSLTIEGWINVSSATDKIQGVITKGQSWGLLLGPDGKLNFRTRSGSVFASLMSKAPIVSNRWHHVAAVFGGGRKLLYIDGVLDQSANFTGPLEVEPLQRVVFSGNSDTGSGQVHFHGRMDGIRIWSDARTQAEILAEMSRDLRGNEPGLIGDWRFDGGDGHDSSWNFLDGQLVGQPSAFAPLSVDGLPFALPPDGALALNFNRNSSTTDFVTVGTGTQFDFKSRMTAETWIFIDQVPAADAALISKGNNAWEILLDTNGKVIFHTKGTYLNNDPAEKLISSTRIEPGAWYHVAVVWDAADPGKSEGFKEIHINGRIDASRPGLSSEIAANTLPVLFGARPLDASGNSTNAHFSGVLDEVRLWNIALPAVQIQPAHDNASFGNELGLVGYWPFNDGGRLPDGGELRIAPDQTAGKRTASDGSFSSAMDILNRVDGVPVGSPLELQYALEFNGTDEFIQMPADPAFESTSGSLTIEAWVNPLPNGLLRAIVMQGDLGYGLAIDEMGRLRYFVNGSTLDSLASTGKVENEKWQHVAVVVDAAAGTTTFYINGRAAGEFPVANVTVRPGQALVVGRLGINGGGFFKGQMDELRIWNSARSFAEIEFFALQSLPEMTLPGLAGYWNFNEGSGGTLGNFLDSWPDGTLQMMDGSNWLQGHFFEGSSVGSLNNLTQVPASAGLWVGSISLNRVNEVQTAVGGASEETTPTDDSLIVRVLLHADSKGALRLLKDVVIMRRRGDPTGPLVLVTNPQLIPNFDGVVKRAGKLVGQRFGSVDYEFDGLELPMLGGLGPDISAVGRITLAANHPANPFRHKYHDRHGVGFAVSRRLSFTFDKVPPDPATAKPGFGTDWISGTYEETITGLHKIPLKVQGAVTLNRISTSAVLNQ
jgi:hypothetical protein